MLMDSNKSAEKKKSQNFIYGLITFVLAYLASRYIARLLGFDYRLSDGINLDLAIDLGIFVACYLIIKYVESYSNPTLSS